MKQELQQIKNGIATFKRNNPTLPSITFTFLTINKRLKTKFIFDMGGRMQNSMLDHWYANIICDNSAGRRRQDVVGRTSSGNRGTEEAKFGF